MLRFTERQRGGATKSTRAPRRSSKAKTSTRGQSRFATSKAKKGRKKRKRSWGSDEGSEEESETHEFSLDTEEPVVAKNIAF